MSRAATIAFVLASALLACAGAVRADATASPPAAESTPASACAVPADLVGPPAALPHVAQAIRSRGALDVLAIGSATMLGPRGGTEGSFPFRMASLLRAAFPGVTVRLVVHGGRGLTAAEMRATLTGEVSQHSYQLVLWQTATVEAVRNLPADELLQTLSAGAEAARSANADLILIDPQYSRFLRANANLDPYLQVLGQAGSLPDVTLFHRYDLMKYWVDSGQIDLERAGKQERQSVADTLHDCLARSLADFIRHAVEAPPP